MIAIVGRICSGKTYFLNTARELGYKSLNLDEFVNDLYEKNTDFINKINNKIGSFLIKNNQVWKPFIKQWISLNPNNLKILEKYVFEVIFEHLKSNQYDFVEIPILYTKIVDFSIFFSTVYHMQIDEENRSKFLKIRGVDNFTKEILDNQNNYNWDTKDFFRSKKVVHIPINMRDSKEKIKEFLELKK
ncbi:hypothetical protein VBM90_01160 [Mycoplasma sp. 2704]|uniref:hypothetical protein n=1 Tax=Mycoplasma sp. 2704 TaxID=3108529 RepID=UPI002B1E0348|nr:hypothetical protein [Mycoplasma sp. 2704]MEA4134412.1 hypothetical protein [Mycoplasma sp. 2704]